MPSFGWVLDLLFAGCISAPLPPLLIAIIVLAVGLAGVCAVHDHVGRLLVKLDACSSEEEADVDD